MEVLQMKSFSYVSLALVAAFSLLVTACGGGGETSPTPVTLSAVSPVLVNYSTTVFANFSGTTVSNGTEVDFSATTPGVLTANTPVTNGKASVRVKSSVRSDVTVSVSSGNYAGRKLIKFIPQPDKAVVHVALNRNLSNLATLNAIVKSDLGAVFTTPTSPAVTPSASYTALVDSSNSFTFAPGQDVYSWLLLKLGINVTSGQSVMDITFTRDPATTTAGIPFFSVAANASNPDRLSFNRYSSPTYVPPNAAPAVNLIPNDYRLTTDYYLGTELLTTN